MSRILTSLNRSYWPHIIVGMLKTRKARLRLLSYIGLGILAIATVIVVAYATTTPGWDGPFLNYKR